METIKSRLSELEQLHSEMQQSYEDRIYRFYHGSFKVYDLQQDTIQAVALFRDIGQSINVSHHPAETARNRRAEAVRASSSRAPEIEVSSLPTKTVDAHGNYDPIRPRSLPA